MKIRRESDLKTYALKVVVTHTAEDQKYVDQAENEFAVGSKLDHPHIMKVYAFEKTKKLFRITGARLLIEYVEGLPMLRCRELPLYRLVVAFFKAADALTYMHGKGYFHADMKPDNIMVSPEGEVKIIDLGLAWRRGETKDRVQGTMEYLAPEQARRKTVNEKTDIFNFGATMYRMFTNNPVPSQLREAGANLVGSVDDFVQPIRKVNDAVPRELDDLVRQCIKIKPDDRPGSMRDVRDRLRDIGRALKKEQARG